MLLLQVRGFYFFVLFNFIICLIIPSHPISLSARGLSSGNGCPDNSRCRCLAQSREKLKEIGAQLSDGIRLREIQKREIAKHKMMVKTAATTTGEELKEIEAQLSNAKRLFEIQERENAK